MKNFKYAVATAAYAPASAPILLTGDICSNLRKAKEFGYDAVEIHMREDELINIDEIKRVMKETGVGISMIATGRLATESFCSLLDDRPYVTDSALDSIKKYIDIASAVGADIILGWVIGNIPVGALSPEKYLDRLATNLSLLSEYAVGKNVKLNIESINRYEVNVFTTVKTLNDFIEKYNLKNIYIHIDTFHMNIDEISFEDAINTAGSKLGYVHLADNHRRCPGTGSIDFKNVLDLLQNVNYNGYLSMEFLPVPSGEVVAKQAVEYIKSL